MSDVFFEDLGIARPDIFLGVGSGSHAEQTAKVMVEFEKLCFSDRPNLVVVVGDVNSTLACSLVAAKLGITLCHVEAGLRSGDWSMPEEVNRVLTDRMSDLLLTPSSDGNANLAHEGICASKIALVGNVMIDTLFRLLPKAKEIDITEKFGVSPNEYALITLHRPSNVDVFENAKMFVEVVRNLSDSVDVIFPIHPRTKKQFIEYDILKILESSTKIHVLEPIGYINCVALNFHSKFVLTDSGGLQEETTALGVPCITARESTERPITVTEGTNTVVGTSRQKIEATIEAILRAADCRGQHQVPKYWDGNAAVRSVDCIEEIL
jgi:UDP-N-acetylglucosamine 2-epimerase (non-hydrolysing)